MTARAFGKCTSKGIAGPDDTNERRKTGRQAAYRNARLLFEGEQVACIAQDVSAAGCRIAIEGAENLPDTIVLILSAGAAPRRAEVIWREKAVVGVKFLQD